MVKSATRTAILVFALVGAGVQGEEPEPEVLNIKVEVNDVTVASPEVRLTAVVWNLDKNHDQYLTEDEVLPALNRLQRSIDNARLRHYMEGRQEWKPGSTRRAESLRGRTLNRLAEAQSMLATIASELSLVDEEFHTLFADLPGEQRTVLLEADVQGNNDGTATVREFYSHIRKLLRQKTRFEADFGEEAYLTVLRRFDAL